jgi:hypothetical protein
MEYRGGSREKAADYAEAAISAVTILGLPRLIDGDHAQHAELTWRALHLAETGAFYRVSLERAAVVWPDGAIDETSTSNFLETHYCLSVENIARLAIDAIDYLKCLRA